MDESFSQYRPLKLDIMDDSDCEVIGDSDDSSSLNLLRKSKMSEFSPKIIADSDSDSSVEESFIIRPKKKINQPLRLDSDSDVENENSANTNEDDGIAFTTATRLSIFGIKPADADSDESDFIKSDDEENISPSSPEVSLSDMAPNPHVGAFMSSTNVNIDEANCPNYMIKPEVCDLTNISSNDLDMSGVEIFHDECNKDVIQISSDDEISEDVVMVTPKIERRKTIEPNGLSQPSIQTYLKKIDKTYPNSQLVYVSKQEFQNEKEKLEDLRQNHSKIKKLLEGMNLDTLPDKGMKLRRRCEEIVVEIKKHAEKVANMVVDKGDVKNNEIMSWEDLKKGSDAVKPKMFGSQAMNTHNTQRILTLERLQALHASLGTRPSDESKASPPKGLLTTLMPHQLHALGWLAWRETQIPRGGILADDMGLGKTLTMISLIVHSKENNCDNIDDQKENEDLEWNGKKNGKLISGGTLVVCPASLLNQWYGEVETHFKKHILRVEIHHGTKRETRAHTLGKNDIVITTYNIVQRDLEKQGVLMRLRWKRVILDEAHIVRNYKALTSRAVFSLVANSRWCLTGTPVHNKDLDLFSLLKFLRCSPFDDIVLWKKWIDNKSTGGQERLTTVMKTLMLRRTKIQLQEQNALQSLPNKVIKYIDVTLSKEEMNVYQKVLVFSRTLFAQFLHQRAEISNNAYGYNSKDNKTQERFYRMHQKMAALHGTKEVKSHEILVLLLRLRQICCHAGLIHKMLEDELNPDLDTSVSQTGPEIDILGELSKLNIADEMNPENILYQDEAVSEGVSAKTAVRQILHVSNPVFNLQNRSAKINAVLKCLKEHVFYKDGDKAIIVSQWTGMLDIVNENLKAAGITCSTLSGKVPVATRQGIIKEFNDQSSNVKVLLLSLCAGGVGLNLIGGNHLLLVDLHWNPQLEAQAQDRIYRVGQTKNVFIYKFVCKDTVESSIKKLQDKKLELAENVLTGVKTIQSSKLSIEDLKLMFNMQ